MSSRVGILVIGSLYWREEPVRLAWRNTRLRVDCAIKVKAPIHYGRLSKTGTYTMTFAPGVASGTALVVPCKDGHVDLARLKAEGEALWGAEDNSSTTRAISAGWGSVGALFRDLGSARDLAASWRTYFREAGGRPISPVDMDGLLQFSWPERVGGQSLDFDVLLATSNRETGKPTTDQIADAWMEHPGSEEYFFKNVQHGIRTHEDAMIWHRMKGRPEWAQGAAAVFPEAVAILGSEAV